MVRCRCRWVALLKTSWTDLNPGRRFFCCPKDDGCGFVDWYDPEMCDRSKEVIPGLLKNINRKERKIAELEAELDIEKGQLGLLMNEIHCLRSEVKRLKVQLRNQKMKKGLGTLLMIMFFFLFVMMINANGGSSQKRTLPLPP